MSRAFAVLLVPAILVALSVAQGTSVQRDEDVLYKGEPAAYWFKLLKESDNPQQGKRPTQGELGDYEAKRNKAKEAAEALERIGPAAKAFVPGLIKLLKYRNPEERFFRRHVLEASLRSLGAIGPDARDAIPEIVRVLKHKVVPINQKKGREPLKPELDSITLPSAAALGKICQSQTTQEGVKETPDAKLVVEVVVPALIDTLKEGNRLLEGEQRHFGENVSETAAKALGRIGPPAKSAVPSLMETMMKAGNVAKASSGSLAKIGEAAVPALIKALNDKDVEVRRIAARTLGEIGSDAKAALSALKSLSDESRDARPECVEAIKKIEGGK